MKFNHNLEGRKVYSYTEYRTHIDGLLSENRTTGDNHSEAMLGYTKMNIARINRLDKRATISEELSNEIKNLKPQTWLTISEAWCGDAAQNLPWIKKMADLNPDIELKLILRDENLDIMDEFLTNNGRAIPKVIALDKTNEIIWTWGPRPQSIQKEYIKLKEEGLPYSEISTVIHKMYARDKGVSLHEEFKALLG